MYIIIIIIINYGTDIYFLNIFKLYIKHNNNIQFNQIKLLLLFDYIYVYIIIKFFFNCKSYKYNFISCILFLKFNKLIKCHLRITN